MGHHELGHVIGRHVRAKRAGTRPHHSLDPLVLPSLELLGPEETHDDARLVHHDTRIPSGRCHPLTNRVDRLLQPAGRHIPTSHGSSSGTRGVRPLGRKPCRQPVELAAHVVVHLMEPKALEPPRGSWAQVSGRVPAVDEYRPNRIERPPGLRLEASKWQTDGSRKMVLLELLSGQYLHHLRPLSHEALNVRTIDLLRHRHSRVSRCA
jgi:hypothetical protein